MIEYIQDRLEWEIEMNQRSILALPLLLSLSYGVESTTLNDIENFWIWIALFALGIIGILILFISSLQTKKIEKVHKEIFDRQLEMEKNQTKLLSNMSENIYGMVNKALKKEEGKGSRKESSMNLVRQEPKLSELDSIDDIEDRLLTVTNDLIEFLRLKSEKIEIVNETFNLNNVLNEISGYICNKYKGKQVDLIFDINHNVPRLFVGDSLHLGQVINNILEHMMERLDNAELKLAITMYNTYEDDIELEFLFHDTGEGITEEELESLFNPYYDEESSTYRGLGLFVSHALVKMMNGELSAQSQVGKGTSFTLTVPLEIYERQNRRMYRLPEKVLTSKKVFIVDNNYNSALAIKKTFAYFRHEVKVLSREAFLKNMPSLNLYDIVVFNESLFTPRLLDYLGKIKKEKELKVISLNTLLNNKISFKDDLIDVYLYTPLNQERIFEMIVGMYNINVESIEEEQGANRNRLKIVKSHISETKGVTRQNFSDFAGKSILIVEDNVINQKVLASLLQPAGLKISVANNGKEAVDIVKGNRKSFDLILMDINMPILDGYAATELIRQDPKYNMLPIIAFTALVLDSEIEKMFKCGINAFLSKPLNIGKLYTALNMFLSKEENGISEETKKVSVAKKEEVVSLRGLDIKHGIAHANNSKVLYMEILSEFMEAYGKSDVVFKKLVNEHRYEQIKMLCIDMRGLTGTIGAYEMQELINKIHQAILYKNQATLPGFINSYHNEIMALNSAIEEYLSNSDYKVA
jgi:CheY-like chemotaxis protein/signal transduction histidine kinase